MSGTGHTRKLPTVAVNSSGECGPNPLPLTLTRVGATTIATKTTNDNDPTNHSSSPSIITFPPPSPTLAWHPFLSWRPDKQFLISPRGAGWQPQPDCIPCMLGAADGTERLVGQKVRLEVSDDGGETWHVAWEHTLAENPGERSSSVMKTFREYNGDTVLQAATTDLPFARMSVHGGKRLVRPIASRSAHHCTCAHPAASRSVLGGGAPGCRGG